MQLIIRTIIILLLLQSSAWAGYSGSSPTWATTPDYASVSDCVAAASSGDTIQVTAGDGSEAWPSQLTINKAVSIVGPGASNLTITSGYTGTGNRIDASYYLIVYQPSSPNDTLFRISGFAFDMNWNSGFIALINSSTTPATKTRIDNNTILNADQSICLKGHFYGVVDHNIITQESRAELTISNYGTNSTTWDNFTFSYGSANNMYYEDNIITFQNCIDHGLGGRSCFRYNTWIFSHSSLGAYPWIDAHGNMGTGGNYSTMGFEFYGNKLTSTHNLGVGMIDQRGGKALVFYNDVVSSGAISTKVREEIGDSYNPTTSAQPQHVSDTYFWINKKNNSTEISPSIASNVCASYVNQITPICPTIEDVYSVNDNDELHKYTASFNGTSGMGCGSLANRPETCTTGVAYWATNQSCADLTGMVGQNPTTPISGTLYKCTAPNTWEEYYAPYIYPHPLSGNATITIADSDPKSVDTSTTDVTVSYNIAPPTCKWRLGSAPDASNGTAFSGYNPTITGLSDGENILYVACDGPNNEYAWAINDSLIINRGATVAVGKIPMTSINSGNISASKVNSGNVEITAVY